MYHDYRSNYLQGHIRNRNRRFGVGLTLISVGLSLLVTASWLWDKQATDSSVDMDINWWPFGFAGFVAGMVGLAALGAGVILLNKAAQAHRLARERRARMPMSRDAYRW